MQCNKTYLGYFDNVLAAATCYKNFADGFHPPATASREGSNMAVCSKIQPDTEVLCNIERVMVLVEVFISCLSIVSISITHQLSVKSPCDACLVASLKLQGRENRVYKASLLTFFQLLEVDEGLYTSSKFASGYKGVTAVTLTSGVIKWRVPFRLSA